MSTNPSTSPHQNVLASTRQHWIWALAALMLLAQTSYGQKDLGDEQIDVVKAYQPMLSDAYKISDVPASDTMVNYVPDMTYALTRCVSPPFTPSHPSKR